MPFFKFDLLALLAAVLLLGATTAHAATAQSARQQPLKRLAIVVGNSQYQGERLQQLANAANDATRISESLKRLNFDVLTMTNVTAAAFRDLLADAERKLPTASAVLIFYAGHGVQIGGENYLLAVDTPDPRSAEDLTSRAIRLNDVIARFADRNRQTFVFLDACRNNPLAGTGAAGNGLAQVEVGENTFIAFATQPGNVTADGVGQNSPFTTALLKYLELPDRSISDMMIDVRNETEALTAGRQVPWDQSNLREQFFFTEDQVLDKGRLNASMLRIMGDPKAKAEFEALLPSYDLQTAVLIVGQTNRSIGALLDGSDMPATGGTQVASLDPGQQGASQNVASDLGTLIVGLAAKDGESEALTLAKKVQTELRRLGCYRMAVDGDWGKGSTRALKDFYRNAKQPELTTAPTAQLLFDLYQVPGRVCREPVVIKRVAATSVSDGGGGTVSRGDGGRRPAAAGGKRPVRPPAAPPPDISSGIGIGGVF